MPEPVPAPTAEQIEYVAEITFLSTDEVTEMVADYEQGIANAKWARTLADITEWSGGLRVESGDVKKVGSIEFFENKSVDYRLDFRNRVLRRYGKTPLLTETDDARGVITSTLGWF